MKTVDSINPSEMFLDMTNFMDDITNRLESLRKEGKRPPVTGFCLFIDNNKVTLGPREGSVILTNVILDPDDKENNDLMQLSMKLAKMMRRNPYFNMIINGAVSIALRDYYETLNKD